MLLIVFVNDATAKVLLQEFVGGAGVRLFVFQKTYKRNQMSSFKSELLLLKEHDACVDHLGII